MNDRVIKIRKLLADIKVSTSFLRSSPMSPQAIMNNLHQIDSKSDTIWQELNLYEAEQYVKEQAK